MLSLSRPVFLLHNRDNHSYLKRLTEVTWHLVSAPCIEDHDLGLKE